MSNKTYDFLKLLGTIILPAISVFYKTLADIWGLPFVDEIPATIMAIDLLLNSCLGISSANYYKNMAAMITENEKAAISVEDVEHSLGGEDVDSEQG